MTVQLIIMGTRRPDSDDAYEAYGKVAVPIMVEAGGTFTGQYVRIDDLAKEITLELSGTPRRTLVEPARTAPSG